MTEPIDKRAAVLRWIEEQEAICEKATPGPWAVWPGPEYVGGGADLCIGSGREWLANMDHRHCENYAHHIGYHEGGCKPETCVDICSLTDEITAEQRATADMIASSRSVLPLALAALKAAALEHELKQDEFGWYCKGCEWTLLDGNFCPTIETLYSSLSLQQR